MQDPDIPFVFLSPSVEGHITVGHLALPRGFVVTVLLNYSQMSPGVLFRAVDKGFHFQLACSGDAVHLVRNQAILTIPFAPHGKRTGNMILSYGWEPDSLELNVIDNLGQRECRTPTAPIYPPETLKNWARQHALIPNIKYRTAEHFFETILELFENLRDRIRSTDAINPFWDIHLKGSKIIKRVPKREVDIHPAIRLFFDDYEIIKNIQVIPEYPTGGGNLDFLITGTLEDGTTVKVCVEFKHAHSKDIEHGILHQLPAYMTSAGTDFGIYCVLDFSPDVLPNLNAFNHGSGGDANLGTRLNQIAHGFGSDTTLETRLQLAASRTNRKFLKMLILSVGRQETPSRKR